MKTGSIPVSTKQWPALVVVLALALLVSVGPAWAKATAPLDEPSAGTRSGPDSPVPICVDKTSILFDEANIRKGAIIIVENTSGLDLRVGIGLPQKGLIYRQVIRKPEQTKVPRDAWDRFIVRANSGIFIILAPENHPEQLEILGRKHIVIKVYRENEPRETLRIPIKVAPDLKPQARGPSTGSSARSGKEKEGVSPRTEAPRGTPQLDAWGCRPKPATGPSAPAMAGAKTLIEAAKQGDVGRVRQLLAEGADVNSKDRYGWTALMLAAEQGHSEAVKALLAKGADVNAKDEEGRVALMSAAGKGQMGIVRLLLDQGADVNAMDKHGGTPLMEAAIGGHTDVVKLLLDKGADVNAKDETGLTALLIALWQGSSEQAHSLPGTFAYWDACYMLKPGSLPLKKAFDSRYVQVVQLLLGKGVDVNAKLWAGFTALTWAAARGHADVVKLLLDKGADVHAKDGHGSTALKWAAVIGHADVVKLLRSHGAVMTLSIAAIIGDKGEIQRLLDAGAGINATNQCGRTALMEAARAGDMDTVSLLLDKGASVNSKDKDGESVLMAAVCKGRAEVVKLLKAHGAKE